MLQELVLGLIVGGGVYVLAKPKSVEVEAPPAADKTGGTGAQQQGGPTYSGRPSNLLRPMDLPGTIRTSGALRARNAQANADLLAAARGSRRAFMGLRGLTVREE
jgi:hypothetical protein